MDYMPKIGKEFKSEEEAEVFYNDYARVTGFSIRRSKVHRKLGVIVDRIFCCSREGKREKDKWREDNVKKPRAETRIGCKVEMRIRMKCDGKFEVTNFEPLHNHELVQPKMVHFLRSHRKLTIAQTAQVDMADSSGIEPSTIMELMSRQAGGSGNIGFIVTDCNNYLRRRQKITMKRGDAKVLLEYFQKKRSEDPSFFYTFQLDEDDMVSNIFWADSRMRNDYNLFGDVICFDTTYKTNTEDRPFGLFVGVNNHKQTIIFCAVLLYDETTETFKWLFDAFIKAMFGKAPKTIMTDQNQAMITAISHSLPNTYHRLCIWHMYQNAAKQLHGVFLHNKSFSEDFQRCVYEYENDEEFKEEWNAMIERYNLQGNSWLEGRFKEREKWSLAYGRNTFCADMVTTQRSEAMNSSLKQYLHTSKDMFRFLENFDRMVARQRDEELRANCNMSQSVPVSFGRILILEHAKTIYTPSKFDAFQNEVLETMNCFGVVCENDDTTIKYMVSDSHSCRRRKHIVIFLLSDSSVSCSCKKFDFVGILCTHALWVLHFNNVKRIPDKYILDRWRKDVRVSGNAMNNELGNVESDPSLIVGKRYRDICHEMLPIASMATGCEDGFQLVLNTTRQLKQKLRELLIHSTIDIPSTECKEFGNAQLGNVDVSCDGIKIDDNVGQEHIDDGDLSTKVQGLKQKQRAGRASSSVCRDPSALEKAISKCRKKSKTNESKSVPKYGVKSKRVKKSGAKPGETHQFFPMQENIVSVSKASDGSNYVSQAPGKLSTPVLAQDPMFLHSLNASPSIVGYHAPGSLRIALPAQVGPTNCVHHQAPFINAPLFSAHMVCQQHHLTSASDLHYQRTFNMNKGSKHSFTQKIGLDDTQSTGGQFFPVIGSQL